MVELTRAQKLLAAKSLAVKAEKEAAALSKHRVEESRRHEISRKKDLALEHKRTHGTKVMAHYVQRQLAAFAIHEAPKPAPKAREAVAATNGRSQSSPAPGADPREEPDPHHRPPRQRPPNAWAKMYELEQKEVQAEELRRRQAAAAAQRQMKASLDVQHGEKLKLAAQDRAEVHAVFLQQQREMAAYQSDQQTALAAKEKKQREDNAEFARMVDEARRRKARQHELELKAELAEVSRTKAALEQDRLRLEHEKHLKALEVERVKLENKALQDQKRAAVAAEQEEDRRVHKQYMERMAEQERQRLEALERTYARQEKRVNMALLNVVSDAEKARLDEERAKRIQAEVDARNAGKEAIKKAREEESNRLQRAALEKQHADRVAALQREKELNYKADKDWIQDTLAAEVQARAKQVKKYAEDKAYRQTLADQMLAEQRKRETTDKWAMNETELVLNAERLRKAGVPVATKPR
ncbi:hypothetical protein ACHHYP_10615 [Achlya hypogyna]|uniref:Trichohyalin-plectin-homology domain-containing protein n=1 Tax=Achlya hypogyna TaxID=1202772 RepID=A0A1V9YKZ2_ACHHY|nr:hypothetical protein ACHHYP_10615 [Achlya hypogyna]